MILSFNLAIIHMLQLYCEVQIAINSFTNCMSPLFQVSVHFLTQSVVRLGGQVIESSLHLPGDDEGEI